MSQISVATGAACVADVIRTRRTIGSFLPDAVDESHVAQALELALWAPNHRKTEPWRFTRIGPQTKAALIDLSTELITAKSGAAAAESKRQQWSVIPGWIGVTCRISADAFLMEEDYAACCCAVQNLMLALWSQGIGSKWSTGEITRHPRYAELLGFDSAQERTVGLIWYGKPAVLPVQTRRPFTEVVRDCP